MEECAIPANHDFVPMDVGNSEPDRARVEIAHDETREEPRPGLHQEAQIVLFIQAGEYYSGAAERYVSVVCTGKSLSGHCVPIVAQRHRSEPSA